MQGLSTAAPKFQYQELFDLGHDDKTPYKKLTGDYVSTIKVKGRSQKADLLHNTFRVITSKERLQRSIYG